MASTFFGIEIAKTGLFVSQKNLNLTGHNIANADTKGYTRQRIISESIDPVGVHLFWSLGENGRVGGGVRVNVLERVRDGFIDRQIRKENGTGGSLAAQAEEMIYLESVFNSVRETDNALILSFEDFVNSLEDLATEGVSDAELRRLVVSNAEIFTDTLHAYYNKLVSAQKDMDDAIVQNVKDVNSLLTSIAAYNDKIFRYELTGEPANDLRDKLDVALDELSGLIDIQYSVAADGKLTVQTTSVPPVTLVNHKDVTELRTNPNAAGFHDVQWLDTSLLPAPGAWTALAITGGELHGHLVMRDGNTINEYGIPCVMDRLNEFAKTLADKFNAIHNAGHTMTGNTPVDFFTYTAGSPASSIQVNAVIKTDPMEIACATNAVTPPLNIADKGNLDKLLVLLNNSNKTAVSGDSFQGYLNGIVAELGTQSKKVQDLYVAQSSVISSLLGRRESVSGVNIDEETTNMIKFQHAYAANARMITALDEALDVLINRTGVVGR